MFSLLFCNIFGGQSLVYLVPRKLKADYYNVSFLWSLIVVSLQFVCISLIYSFSPLYVLNLCLLTLLQALISINQAALLARQNVARYNAAVVFQILIQLITLLSLFYVLERRELSSFILAMYIAGFAGLLLSMFFNREDLFKLRFSFSWDTVRSMFNQGIQYQSFEFLQFINMRFGFFLLMRFEGKISLGIYSIAISLLEATWLIGRSLAVVQYSRIANIDDESYQKFITLNLIKIVAITGGLAVLMIIAVPIDFYVLLFGKGFAELKHYMRWLIPGTYVYNIFLVLAHYFAGRGLSRYNIIASAAGAFATIVFGYFLIIRYEMSGTAFSASMAYGLSTLLLLAIFHKMNNFKLSDYLISMSDFRNLRDELKTILLKRQL